MRLCTQTLKQVLRPWLALTGLAQATLVVLAPMITTTGAFAQVAAQQPEEVVASKEEHVVPTTEIGARPLDTDFTPWIPGAKTLDIRDGKATLPAAQETPVAANTKNLQAARRLALFDFEEINDMGVKLGRGLALPPGWYATGRPPQSRDPNFERLPLHTNLTQRPGFPSYCAVGYSKRGAGADSEGYALHLGLQGGNSGAFVQVGRLPVVPGTRYRISAAVRTADLTHAGARVAVYFVDPHGRRLGESVQQTQRLQTGGAWQTVELILNGNFERAAYLGLEVELVQPVADPLHPLGDRQVVLSDIKGDAWFDNLSIEQLPLVQVTSDNAVGVVRAAKSPGWNMAVRDLRGERLIARLTLYDARSRVIDEQQRPLDWGATTTWKWAPPLPQFGFYRVQLHVEDLARPGDVVASDEHTVVWLPPLEPLAGGVYGTHDLGRFALIAESAGSHTLNQLPELLDTLGLQTAVISAFARDTVRGALIDRVDTVARYFDEAAARGLWTELSLYPLPAELEPDEKPEATLQAMLYGPSDKWFEYLQPVVAQKGTDIRAWHLGGAMAKLTNRPAAQQAAMDVYEILRHWTPEPQLVLPGSLTDPMALLGDAKKAEPPADVLTGPGKTAMRLATQAVWSVGLTPQAISENRLKNETPTAKGSRRDEPGAQRRWLLKLPDAATLGQPERAADVALRVIHAWERGATAVALESPWRVDSHGVGTRVFLDPVAGVMAQTARRLAGLRAMGRLPLHHGLEAMVFGPVQEQEDQDATGLLVAWNRSAPGSESHLDIVLTDSVGAFDVWGNPLPLSDVKDDNDEGVRRVRIMLSDAPVFITGVNAQMLAFRSGFRVNEPLIPSYQTPHDRVMTLHNPWPVTLSGSLSVTGPPGWEAVPRDFDFSLPAGKSQHFPVSLSFPVSALAGPKMLSARLRFTAEDGRHDVTLSTPIELGLPGVGFEPQLSLRRDAQGMLQAQVTCVVVNQGDAPISLGVFASLPGHARQERLISRLAPGQAVQRRFTFHNAELALQSHDISVGLRETQGAGLLNMRVGVAR
ncbi:MAG: NEW3 domain-containing protein [Algisphaera sp.]